MGSNDDQRSKRVFAQETYGKRDLRNGLDIESVRPHAVDEEFAELTAVELRKAYRIAGYLLGDASDAQDAVQEACIRAWRAWPHLRERDRFPAWFSQILVNVCRTKLHLRSRRMTESIEGHDVAGGDPFRAALARDAVGRALPVLSDELRVVVVLRFWGDLSLAEIAERLDIPLGTVKSRLHAALASLRRSVEPASLPGAMPRETAEARAR